MQHLGAVTSFSDVITVTPTVDTSAYTSGDLLFDATEITNILREKDGTVTLGHVCLIDKDDEGVEVELYFTDDSTSWGTINDAVGPTDAVADGVQGVVLVSAGDYYDLANSQVAFVENVNMVLKGEGTSLWVAGVVRGAPTYASASDLVLKLGVYRD